MLQVSKDSCKAKPAKSRHRLFSKLASLLRPQGSTLGSKSFPSGSPDSSYHGNGDYASFRHIQLSDVIEPQAGQHIYPWPPAPRAQLTAQNGTTPTLHRSGDPPTSAAASKPSVNKITSGLVSPCTCTKPTSERAVAVYVAQDALPSSPQTTPDPRHSSHTSSQPYHAIQHTTRQQGFLPTCPSKEGVPPSSAQGGSRLACPAPPAQCSTPLLPAISSRYSSPSPTDTSASELNLMLLHASSKSLLGGGLDSKHRQRTCHTSTPHNTCSTPPPAYSKPLNLAHLVAADFAQAAPEPRCEDDWPEATLQAWPPPERGPLPPASVTALMRPGDGLLHQAHGSSLPLGMARSRWRIKDYAIVRKLYKGYSSSVYQATCRLSGLDVALKAYDLRAMGPFLQHQVYREVDIHRRLSHAHAVALHAVFREDDYLVLVLELARGGNLHRVRRKLGGCLSEHQAVATVLTPLLKMLAYLHAQGIIHRDIKPENLLFDDAWVLKLADFGVAIDLLHERPVTRTGTILYMAPEVQFCPLKSLPEDNKEDENLQYTPAADVWSLGVVAYELLVGQTPDLEDVTAATKEVLAIPRSMRSLATLTSMASRSSAGGNTCSPASCGTPSPSSTRRADSRLGDVRFLSALSGLSDAPSSAGSGSMQSSPCSTPAAPGSTVPSSLRMPRWQPMVQASPPGSAWDKDKMRWGPGGGSAGPSPLGSVEKRVLSDLSLDEDDQAAPCQQDNSSSTTSPFSQPASQGWVDGSGATTLSPCGEGRRRGVPWGTETVNDTGPGGGRLQPAALLAACRSMSHAAPGVDSASEEEVQRMHAQLLQVLGRSRDDAGSCGSAGCGRAVPDPGGVSALVDGEVDVLMGSLQRPKLPFPPGISPEARDFILAALHPNAHERPTMQALLAHPWINMYAAP